eukprot:scaffold7398_cov58-Phaeocystis_antarctica.AAC.2
MYVPAHPRTSSLTTTSIFVRLICHFVNLVLVQEIAATPGADATTFLLLMILPPYSLLPYFTDYLPSRPAGDRGHVADEPRRLDRACRLGMGAAACPGPKVLSGKLLSFASQRPHVRPRPEAHWKLSYPLTPDLLLTTKCSRLIAAAMRPQPPTPLQKPAHLLLTAYYLLDDLLLYFLPGAALLARRYDQRDARRPARRQVRSGVRVL